MLRRSRGMAKVIPNYYEHLWHGNVLTTLSLSKEEQPRKRHTL